MRSISRPKFLVCLTAGSVLFAGVWAHAAQLVAKTVQETTRIADAVVVGEVKSLNALHGARLNLRDSFQANCLVSEVIAGNGTTGEVSVIFYTKDIFRKTDDTPPMDKLEAGKRYILFIKKEAHRWGLADPFGCALEVRKEYGIFDEDYKDNPEVLNKSMSSINGVPHVTVTHDELIQKIKRAFDGYVLAKFDNQLLEWDKKIEAQKDPKMRPLVKDDKAFCAWRAAKVAVKRKEYDQALKYLGIMRDFGLSWVGNAGDKQEKLLKKFVDFPGSMPVRIEFAKGFWVDLVPALGSDYSEARKVLIEGLEFKPGDGEKPELYQLIFEYSWTLGDTSNVVEYANRICSEYPTNTVVCDRTMFALARYYTAKAEPQRAIEALEKMLTLRPDGPLAGMAYLGLSESYASLKDEASMLRNLEKAAKMPPRHTSRRSDTRQIALNRLGRYYQDRKDYLKALEYYTEWRPYSWCGNGQTQFSWERVYLIAFFVASAFFLAVRMMRRRR